MLEHRLSAIQTLSSLFAKNDVGGLSPTEENEMLVTALLLVLHDMCESGISTHRAHLTGVAPYCDTADETERFLRAWEPDDEVYPTQHPEWRLVAQAWRHVALIRTMPFPDPFEHPCTDDRFRTSLAEILDACARVPRGTTFHKRLLFPLFIAGTETESPHLQDYVRMQLAEIANASAFTQDAMWTILNATWKEREQNTQHWANVPWMEYTCSTLLQRQHDHLFF